ncbi:MAG: hypothetical protein OEZ22_05305 [Spirochaetia bacterium]|nr:hypothetical protein [Spirochaetia bacterium]
MLAIKNTFIKFSFYFLILNILIIKNIYSTGWDRLIPEKDDSIYFLESDGFMTYTYSNVDDKNLPFRHSYLWTHINGSVEFADNYWISSLLSVQYFSLSYSLNEFNYLLSKNISFYPLIHFSGTPLELFLISSNQNSLHQINMTLGTLPNYTHAKGLFYSQYTGLGAHVDYNFKYASFNTAFLGSGYYQSDDVISLEIQSYKKFIGAQCLFERNTPLGDRLISGLNSEVSFNNLILFTEVSYSAITKRKNNYLSDYEWTTSQKKDYSNYDYKYYSNLERLDDYLQSITFSKRINKDNISSLIGFQWIFNWNILNTTGSIAGDFRYYGKNISNFYAYQRYFGFDFFTDIVSDDKYNNQPFNYYVYPGEKTGIYLRQELESNIYKNFFLRIRNEFLYIKISSKEFKNSKAVYGNNIFKVNFAVKMTKNFEYGLQISNMQIGLFESYKYETDQEKKVDFNSKRKPLFLKAEKNLLFDLYLYYYFDV